MNINATHHRPLPRADSLLRLKQGGDLQLSLQLGAREVNCVLRTFNRLGFGSTANKWPQNKGLMLCRFSQRSCGSFPSRRKRSTPFLPREWDRSLTALEAHKPGFKQPATTNTGWRHNLHGVLSLKYTMALALKVQQTYRKRYPTATARHGDNVPALGIGNRYFIITCAVSSFQLFKESTMRGVFRKHRGIVNKIRLTDKLDPQRGGPLLCAPQRQISLPRGPDGRIPSGMELHA